MFKKGKSVLVAIFLLFIFEIILLINNKTELAFYNGILLSLFIIVFFLYSKFEIPKNYMSGLVLIGFLNMIGGLIKIDNIRLYDYFFLGFLRWDMMLHFVSLFLITSIIYFIYDKYFTIKNKKRRIIETVFFALGLGAFFEIVELAGVVLLGNQGVGNYLNNAIDLVSNLVGIIAASIVYYFKQRKKVK